MCIINNFSLLKKHVVVLSSFCCTYFSFIIRDWPRNPSTFFGEWSSSPSTTILMITIQNGLSLLNFFLIKNIFFCLNKFFWCVLMCTNTNCWLKYIILTKRNFLSWSLLIVIVIISHVAYVVTHVTKIICSFCACCFARRVLGKHEFRR